MTNDVALPEYPRPLSVDTQQPDPNNVKSLEARGDLQIKYSIRDDHGVKTGRTVGQRNEVMGPEEKLVIPWLRKVRNLLVVVHYTVESYLVDTAVVGRVYGRGPSLSAAMHWRSRRSTVYP